MIELDGNVWIGLGNEPAGSDGGIISYVNPAGAVTADHEVDEQGIHDMHLHDGKIYVPGTDPTDDWTLGNLYIRGTDGEWVKRRTLPLTIHTWGLCHDDNGDLWAACGCHTGDNATWEGRIMRSQDDGLTWDVNVKLNDYRMYDIIWHAGSYYAIGYHWSSATGYQWQIWASVDGLEWAIDTAYQPARHQRLVAHNGDLITTGLNSAYLIVLHDGAWATYSMPGTVHVPMFNGLASDGEYLYLITNDGYVWRTADIAEWTRYSLVPGAISIGYWPSQGCVIVSDRGTDAKLWRI